MKVYVATAMLGILAVSANAQVLMDQIGFDPADLGTAVNASQDFETANNPLDLSIIDNFTVAGPTTLSSAEAFLTGFNGFATFSNVTRYRVEIYSAPAVAAASLTGDLGSQSVLASGVTVNTGYAPSIPLSARVTIPISISLSSGGTFWLAIVPVMDFAFGQTGVRNSNFAGGFPNGNNSIQVNPGGGFGLPGNQQGLQNNAAYRLTAAPVPEPMSMIAIAMGMGALALRRRKKA